MHLPSLDNSPWHDTEIENFQSHPKFYVGAIKLLQYGGAYDLQFFDLRDRNHRNSLSINTSYGLF